MAPPLNLVNMGLGSNVSTCDGPPFKNRKITCLALGAKCGDFGSNDPASACASLASRPANPTIPNPFPACRSASRLVIIYSPLIHKQQFIGTEQYLRVRQPVGLTLGYKIATNLNFLGCGFASENNAVGLANSLICRFRGS